MFKLIYKSILVLLMAFLFSVAVDSLYRQVYKQEYKFPRNIDVHPEIKDKYKLVKLGNSHSDDGITFEKYNIKSLNLASVAQTYEYDLALLKMHARQIDKNATILINISPISFSQKKPQRGELVNTQYYELLSPFLIPHLNISEYLQIQAVPFVRAGHLWRTMHAKKMKEQAMSTFVEDFDKAEIEAVKPEVPTAKVITTALVLPTPSVIVRSELPTFKVAEIQAELHALPDPSSDRLVESKHFMINKWNNSGGFNKASFETNRKDLQGIIDYCLEQGWRPVLVTLPMNQVLLEGLGPDYYDNYIYDNLKKIDLHDTPYINFIHNTQLTKNKYLYSNSDHLNKKGALITSYLLLQQLIESGNLPKEADGYDYSPSTSHR